MRSEKVVHAILGCGVVAALLLSGCLGGGNTEGMATSDLTIEFDSAPAPIHPGNLTIWTKTGSSWTMETQYNDGLTVWRFEDITSASNCYDQLLAASDVAGFEVGTEEQILGTLVTSIGDLHNLEYEGKAWQYFVNGTYANRACDRHEIGEGTEVIWRYMQNQLG